MIVRIFLSLEERSENKGKLVGIEKLTFEVSIYWFRALVVQIMDNTLKSMYSKEQIISFV